MIAKAIDEKSPYTANHCRRVPVITQMIAEAACESRSGPWETFQMSEDEMYELNVAAWLDDCGKITTPEAVVDKATKLEGIRDGIELIDTRFEVLKRDAVIDYLKSKLGKSINLKEAKELQEELDIPYFFETSSKTGENNKNVFEMLTEAMLKKRELI